MKIFMYVVSINRESYGIYKGGVDKGKITYEMPVVWKIKNSALALLSLKPDTINYIGLLKKGNKTTTGGIRVKLSEFVEFKHPVNSNEFHDNWMADFKPSFRKRFKTDSFHDEETSELIRILKVIRPNQKRDIERLESLINSKFYEGINREIIAQTRDSISLSLILSGIGKDKRNGLEYGTKDLAEEYIPSFLQELEEMDQVKLLEDKMIEHDNTIFSNWEIVSKNKLGVAIFRRGNRKLSIINVNRHRLENLLGVDLIYFDGFFNSFILIQYKRMEEYSGDWVYRPDKSYYEELKRMQDFWSKFRNTEKISRKGDYRMNYIPFYFKFCPNKVVDLGSDDLIRGMYLPIDYLEILGDSPQNRSRNDRFMLTFKNSLRHFNNTEFIDLVKNGWIGSSFENSKIFSKIIMDSLADNKKVVLAEYKYEKST